MDAFLSDTPNRESALACLGFACRWQARAAYYRRVSGSPIENRWLQARRDEETRMRLIAAMTLGLLVATGCASKSDLVRARTDKPRWTGT